MKNCGCCNGASGAGVDEGIRLGTVEAKVASIAAKMVRVCDYRFMNWAQTNESIDSMTRPTIVYILPPSGELDISYHDARDFPLTRIAFLANTELDFEGDENDGIIEYMKRLCVTFIMYLNESGLFSKVYGRVSYQVVYDHLDDNVTGIIVDIPLREEQGISTCDIDGVKR